jgi:methylphosphotriester-DNA--protein-cysteine methyltransferase
MGAVSKWAGAALARSRSFKTSFGISTHQWLMQHRIDHAKQWMSHTSLSLIDIAIQSGFMIRQRARARSVNLPVSVPEDGDGMTQRSISELSPTGANLSRAA